MVGRAWQNGSCPTGKDSLPKPMQTVEVFATHHSTLKTKTEKLRGQGLPCSWSTSQPGCAQQQATGRGHKAVRLAHLQRSGRVIWGMTTTLWWRMSCLAHDPGIEVQFCRSPLSVPLLSTVLIPRSQHAPDNPKQCAHPPLARGHTSSEGRGDISHPRPVRVAPPSI